MIKAEFSASLLQSSVSHDPSEIILIYWFAAQDTFLIIIFVKKNNNKKQHLFKIEIFCNIIDVFTVNFDQCNASLLNKTIKFRSIIVKTAQQYIQMHYSDERLGGMCLLWKTMFLFSFDNEVQYHLNIYLTI